MPKLTFMTKTYYQVLDVSPRADADEIRKAYRKLAKTAHPDVNPSPDAQDKFVMIAEAFEILSDPQKRSVYDLRLRRDRIQSAAARAARNASSHTPPRPTTRAQQERYDAWVRQAKERARANARMPYEDFKARSRVERAELEVFHYLQYFLIFLVFTIATLLMLTPLLAMIYGRWWLIALALVMTPVSLKIMEQCRKGWKELNS